MELQQRFSLAKHVGPYEHWPARTALLCDGVPTGTQIEGYVIEAQYRCEAGHLLITSFDCPFEESNSFTLLTSVSRCWPPASCWCPMGRFC